MENILKFYTSFQDNLNLPYSQTIDLETEYSFSKLLI